MPGINTYVWAQNSANVLVSSKNSHYQTAPIKVKTVASGLFHPPIRLRSKAGRS